jgi:hypothetical protein
VETLNPQARVGCRTATYSTSSGTKSGGLIVNIARVSTYVLNKFNATHGGLISRSCARYIKDQDKVYFPNTFTHAGVSF